MLVDLNKLFLVTLLAPLLIALKEYLQQKQIIFNEKNNEI